MQGEHISAQVQDTTVAKQRIAVQQMSSDHHRGAKSGWWQWSVENCSTPPTPQIGEEIPRNRRNKSADRFFSKTGSQCPGSQSQAPNTPSFWLPCSWSHVET